MTIDNGTLLALTFIITSTFTCTFFWFYQRKKNQDATVLSTDLKKFKKAHELNDIKGIIKYGTKVFYNLNLDKQTLLTLDHIIHERIKDNPQLEALQLLIYNKKLSWTRSIPF